MIARRIIPVWMYQCKWFITMMIVSPLNWCEKSETPSKWPNFMACKYRGYYLITGMILQVVDSNTPTPTPEKNGGLGIDVISVFFFGRGSTPTLQTPYDSAGPSLPKGNWRKGAWPLDHLQRGRHNLSENSDDNRNTLLFPMPKGSMYGIYTFVWFLW